jgi:hypothetical protein
MQGDKGFAKVSIRSKVNQITQQMNNNSNIALALRILLAGTLFLFITSCSDKSGSPEPEQPEITEEQQTAISYFKEIALGLEHGNAPTVTRKWTTEMKIFVGGDPSQGLEQELDTIINDLNQLSQESDFSISTIVDSSNSNAYLFFGSNEVFAKRVPEAAENVGQNYGLFYFWWNGNNELNRMAAYVDMYRTENLTVRKHLLREELTQSLGLAKDSQRFSDSIFNSSYAVQVTKFSEVDKQVIQLLYHPEMETGLNESQVDSKLNEIINDVVPE